MKRRGTRGYRIWVVEHHTGKVLPGRVDAWEPCERYTEVIAAFTSRSAALTWAGQERYGERLRVRSYLRWAGSL